jgi:hypothetical protein
LGTQIHAAAPPSFRYLDFGVTAGSRGIHGGNHELHIGFNSGHCWFPNTTMAIFRAVTTAWPLKNGRMGSGVA